MVRAAPGCPGDADEVANRADVRIQRFGSTASRPAEHDALGSGFAGNGGRARRLGLGHGLRCLRAQFCVGDGGGRRLRGRRLLCLQLPYLPLHGNHAIFEIADFLHECGSVRLRRCGLAGHSDRRSRAMQPKATQFPKSLRLSFENSPSGFRWSRHCDTVQGDE